MVAVTILVALQATVAILVLAILLYLLVRAPENVPLRGVTATIASFSLTVVFGGAAISGLTFLGLAPIVSRLIQHLGMLAGAYGLVLFYVFSALDRPAARRQAWWHAIPVAAAAVILVGSVLLMPADVRYDAAILAYARPGAGPLDQITIAALYVTPNLYMGLAFASAFRWTRRHARGAEPRLRFGLALASLGLAAMAAGEAWFVSATIVRWAGVGVPAWMFPIGLWLLLPGSVIFMIGFVYPFTHMRLAAARIWWQHRRVYHQLAPLWTLLHQRFPEDALGRVPSSRWRDTLSLRSVHRRYYRRVIECRDGLLRVSPYLATNGTGSLAERLRAGLRAHASGAPASHHAVPVAIPATDDLDADARELVTLARELRNPG
jgi:hypothetical protein